MENKFKVVSILFSWDSANNPIRMINEIEIFYQRDGCVAALKSYCGNLFVCTLRHNEIVARVKNENHIYLGRNRCTYKEVETNITSLKIDLPFWNVTIDDVNRMLRAYCNILVSDIEIKHEIDSRNYYAIVEMRKDVPMKLKSKMGYVSVNENV